MLALLMTPVSKILIASTIIALSSWLAGTRPALAGFLIALPLSSLLALAFGQLQHQDEQKSIEFARSIVVAVPLSLTFFVPFLLAGRLHLSFWAAYGAGLVLLTASYFVHRFLTGLTWGL